MPVPNWHEIELFTRLGSQDVPLETVWIPPFRKLPEVLTWGDRSFVLHPDGVYREAFSCPVFSRSEFDEGLQRGRIV